MSGRFTARLKGPVLAVILCLVISAAGIRPSSAQDTEGLLAGPWILTPYLITGYEHDSNPLFLPGGADSDRITILTPGVGAVLPLGNSRFRLNAERSFYHYELLNLDDNKVTELSSALELAFSSSDKLEIRFDRISGLARSVQAFDEGGEAVFQGDTFDLNQYTVQLSREVYGHRGYRFTLEREDLVFDESTSANFFNYRGWSYAGEFREPVAPRRWVLFSLEGRQFDHFRVQDDPGEIFREEDSRMAFVGLDGVFARQWRTRLRGGYGRFRYPVAEGSDYRGLVADFDATYRSTGERLKVRIMAARRPFSSFFFNNTHYVNSSATVMAEYVVRPKLTFGARAQFGRSTYGDRLERPGDPQEGLIRRDRARSTELFGRMELTPWVGLTFSARSSRRMSNYEGVEYEAKSYFGGLAIGWR